MSSRVAVSSSVRAPRPACPHKPRPAITERQLAREHPFSRSLTVIGSPACHSLSVQPTCACVVTRGGGDVRERGEARLWVCWWRLAGVSGSSSVKEARVDRTGAH
ncbi:hypothetical protein O3P69_009497 [Scylla paramamosain]|uniref:Uncharacterized protein n=1 Tax=Scylla paramamosain TaxID=85552 RepID=A0AAW0SVP7_SCYPA